MEQQLARYGYWVSDDGIELLPPLTMAAWKESEPGNVRFVPDGTVWVWLDSWEHGMTYHPAHPNGTLEVTQG